MLALSELNVMVHKNIIYVVSNVYASVAIWIVENYDMYRLWKGVLNKLRYLKILLMQGCTVRNYLNQLSLGDFPQ